MSIIQEAIRQGIECNPTAAAQEVPQIVGHYILSNTLLNELYREVKRYLAQPDRFREELLRRAVAKAEEGIQP